MTKLEVFEDKEQCHIIISGHAGYCPGNDIVCASISTLSYALLNRLEALYRDGDIDDLRVHEEVGNIDIRFAKRDQEKNVRWYTTKDFFMTGMRMIEERFPDNLKIA